MRLDATLQNNAGRAAPRLEYAPPGFARKGSQRSLPPATPINFVLFVLFCQVALLFVGDSATLRLPLRIAVFAVSLLLAALGWPPGFHLHPSYRFLKWVPLILLLGFIHPEHNTYLACAAQFMLNVAVITPILWMASCRPQKGVFEKVVLTIWLFSVASATAGVLQVYYPQSFRGATSTVIASFDTFQHGAAQIHLASGQIIIKPYGLTDQPGGCSIGGLSTIVLGLGICLASRNLILRLLAAAALPVGLFAIYLSQIRSLLILSGLCSITIVGVLLRRRQFVQAGLITALLTAVAIGGSSWAFNVGGQQTINRFSTLTDNDPQSLYQENRGQFLDEFIKEDIFKYPLGAGLGRWGMMNNYFGDPGNGLWSEIMWTSWLFDGGVFLVVVYVCAIAIAMRTVWRISINQPGTIGTWAGIIFAYDAAVFAGTFCFNVFSTQPGVEFWLLNACIYTASKLQPSPMRVQPARIQGLEPLSAVQRPRNEEDVPNSFSS